MKTSHNSERKIDADTETDRMHRTVCPDIPGRMRLRRPAIRNAPCVSRLLEDRLNRRERIAKRPGSIF